MRQQNSPSVLPSALESVIIVNAIFRLSISHSTLEIYEIKLLSCSKTRELSMLGRSKWANTILWLVDQSSSFFLFYTKGTVIYNAIYRLSISASISEILVLKLKSCSKSRQILDVFCLSKFLRAMPPKSCTRVNTST